MGFLEISLWQVLIACLAGYLVGSLNISIIVTRIVAHKDIRTMGSGNAGFTNVLRSVGKIPAIVTFVGDFLKTVVGAFLGAFILTALSGTNTPDIVFLGKALGGFCGALGHMFPCYFKFKGGKGVVSSAALMLVLDWRIMLFCIGVFLAVFFCSKIISLSSVWAAVLYSVLPFFVTYYTEYLPNLNTPHPTSFNYLFVKSMIPLALGLIVVLRHIPNIKRIINGTEKRITIAKNN